MGPRIKSKGGLMLRINLRKLESKISQLLQSVPRTSEIIFTISTARRM